MLAAAFAFIISLIAPGTGQLFNGEFLKAGLILGFFVFGKCAILPLMIRILKFKVQIKLLKFIYCFNILYPIVMIIAAVDGASKAFGQYHSAIAFVYSILLMFIAVNVYRNLKSPFIVAALSGRGDIAKYIFGGK